MKQETTTTPQTLKGFTEGEWIIEKRNGKIFIEAINKDGEETTAVEICQLHGNESIDEKDAALIASAPTLLKENEQLKQEIEVLKHNRNTALSLALEFGYKQCEKGENIQAAFLNYQKLIKEG